MRRQQPPVLSFWPAFLSLMRAGPGEGTPRRQSPLSSTATGANSNWREQRLAGAAPAAPQGGSSRAEGHAPTRRAGRPAGPDGKDPAPRPLRVWGRLTCPMAYSAPFHSRARMFIAGALPAHNLSAAALRLGYVAALDGPRRKSYLVRIPSRPPTRGSRQAPASVASPSAPLGRALFIGASFTL